MSLGGWVLSEVAYGYAWDSCWAFREYRLSAASVSQGLQQLKVWEEGRCGFNFPFCHLPPTCLEQNSNLPFSATLSNLIIFSKPHCTSHKNMKNLAPTSEHCFEVYMTLQELSECLFQWIHFILRRCDLFAMLKTKSLSCLELSILIFLWTEKLKVL